MAEPVGEDRQVKFHFEYDPSYRVVAANGAWIGITPRADLRLDFFIEDRGIPDELVNLVTPEGNLGPELRRSPETRFVRRMQVGVLLSLDQGEALIDFVKTTIQEFRKARQQQGGQSQEPAGE